MKKWSAHMLTGVEKMTRMMRLSGTCRTDAGGPACRRGEACGSWRVARFAVVALMAMVFGAAGFVGSAEAALTTYYVDVNSVPCDGGQITAAGTVVDLTVTTPANCTNPQDARIAISGGPIDMLVFLSPNTVASNTTVTSQATGNLLTMKDRNTTGGLDVTAELREYSSTGTQIGVLSSTIIATLTGGDVDYIDFSGLTGTISAGNKWGIVIVANATAGATTWDTNGLNEWPDAGNQTTAYFTVDETVACTETATVAAVDPGVITAATAITATLGGTGGSAPQVRWSTDGGAFSGWQASGATYTPHVNNSGTVAIETQATGFCGTITDPTPVNTTYDTLCVDPDPSTITIPTGQTAFGDGYDASLLITTTGDPAANLSLQYQVTQQQTTPGTPISVGPVFQPGTGGTVYTNETDIDVTFAATGSGTIDTIDVYLTAAVQGSTLKFFTATWDGTTVTPQNSVVVTVATNTVGAHQFTGLNLPIVAGEFLGVFTGANNAVAQITSGDAMRYATGDTTGTPYTGTNWGATLNLHGSGLTAPVTSEITCTNWTGTAAIPTTTAGGSLCGDYNNGNYVLYSRGTDPDCGTPIISTPVSQTFTWNACTETKTLALDTIANPITGSTTIQVTAGSNATSMLVSDTTPPTQTSPWTYVPPQDSTASVTFYAQGTGDCSTLTDSATVNLSTMAAPVVTAFTGPATSTNLTISGLSITATDNVAVTHYMITESNAQPGAGDAAWAVSVTSYTVASDGAKTLYPWARDAAGNVSAVYGTPLSVTVDSTPPVDGTLTATGGSAQIALSWTAATDATSSAASYDLHADTSVVADCNNAALSIYSGTVLSYTHTGLSPNATWYYRVCATDTLGNQSAGAIANATTDACTPTAQISITATPSAISSVGGTSVITINEDTPTVQVGSAEWSSDGGTIWNASGTSFDPGAQAQGTATIMGRAVDGTCGTAVTATNITVNYDTRTTNLVVLPASATQQGLTGITITMPYEGDKDANATFQYQYQQNAGGFNAWSTPEIDVDNTSPKTFALSGLTSGALVDINVRYIDTGIDHNGNADPQVLQVQLVAWADNDLLHNSLRFACSVLAGDGTTITTSTACTTAGGSWNEDRRYTGGWGTNSSTQYGPILCSTCHEKNTGNIKRIITQVPLAGIPGSAVTNITYTSAVDGSSDLGDTNGAHATSNKICETCHTYSATDPNVSTPTSGVRFHGYDMSGASAGNQSHYIDADCIKCHEHKMGFRASCNACHGNPPVVNTLGGPDGLDNSVGTGSATAGKHQLHAIDKAYGCNTCHTGWEGSGEMPKAGNINIGIVTPGNNGGTYDGRAGGGGYNADAGTGTSVTTGDALTCAIYCHGNTIGGTTTTAVWNDAATIACGDCHKGTATQMQTGALGSHGRHAGNLTGATYQLNLTCDNCHGSVPVLGDTHMDGLVAWDVTVLSGSTPTYAGAASGSAGPAPTTYDSCVNVYCHSDVQNNGGTVVSPTFAAPTWGGAVACGDCHGAAVTGRPTTGSHVTHNAYGCTTCHNGAGDETINHANENIDVTFAAAIGGSYSQSPNPAGNGYGSCSTVSCHGAGTPTWGATGTVACGDCHGTSGTFGDNRDGAPPVDLAGLSGSYEVGKHQKHLNVSFSNTTPNSYCNLCHSGAGTGTANHANGTVEVNFDAAAGLGATWTDTGVNVAPGGSCGSLDANSCHGNTTWNPANTFNCNDCHGFGGVDPGHVTDSRGITGVNCEHCHESGHPQGTTATTILIPNNLTVGIDYNSGGIHLLKTIKTITNATEAETCWSCHDAQGTPVSEWGVNNNANTGGLGYDYGSLSASNWTTATWSSANQTDFSYKNGVIKSTHSANLAGTSVVSGTAYSVGGMTEAQDAVGDIRCSYCHDVHDRNLTSGDAVSGQPYLRGTWKGNPYNEDGAPQTAHDGGWTESQNGGSGTYGLVPRGSASSTNNGGVGGYWIDQNSGNPNNGETLATTAGLCKLCHSQGFTTDADIVDNMDVAAGEGNAGSEGLWVGTNGHSNAVIGGTGSAAANIFRNTLRGGNATPTTNTGGTNGNDVSMGLAQETNRGFSYRGSVGYNYTPNTNPAYRPYAFEAFEWGVSAGGSTAQVAAGTSTLTVDENTTQSQYHTFNCGKCHNPHASRLPKLMITNCLDNNHNTWQDVHQVDGSGGTTDGERLSNWLAAQNCHRRGPAEATGATGSGTVFGPGWNKVTPW